ncbi:MAG: MarP family serine protease [Nitriliruptoraceae bacterium]
MNVLDALLAVAVIAAVVGGFRAGFVSRATSWIGILAGLFLANRTIPWALDVISPDETSMRLFVVIVALTVTVGVTTGVTGLFGAFLSRAISVTPLAGLDRLAGGLASVLMIGVLVWLLIPAAAGIPGQVAQQVRGSRVVATITTQAPDPPDVLRGVRRFVDSSRFPEVFADLAPAPATGPSPRVTSIDTAVIDSAATRTAHVRADGCGRRFEGSSFVIGDGLLLTNAHVVAGADSVRVRFPDGTEHTVTVVVHDPERDLALLEASGMTRSPLELVAVSQGDEAVVIGFPGGQLDPRVAPARVEGSRAAVGRDIYGDARTERRVVFLAAELQQGDSGSPLVDDQGRVGGVVFAVSPDRRDVAYALDLDEIHAVLDAERTPGETGPCM